MVFSEGDLVLVYDQKNDTLRVGKFVLMWLGPYIVKHVLGKGAYELIDYEENTLGEPKNRALSQEVLCLRSSTKAIPLYMLYHTFLLFFSRLSYGFNSCHDCLHDWQMLSNLHIFVGFIDAASRHTQNAISATWILYFPFGQLVSLGGACLGPPTNKIAKYFVVIELFSNDTLLGVWHILVHIDSQLIVS